MELAEIVLTEVAPNGDPGPRSTRPEWLGVVAYLSGTQGGRRYVGGGTAVLPHGVQSPWNAPAVAEALDDAVRTLVGTTLGDDSAPGREAAGAVVARFADLTCPSAETRGQRAALSCLSSAVELAVLDLLARAERVDAAEVVRARVRAAGGEDDTSAQPHTFDVPGGPRIRLARDGDDDTDGGWVPGSPQGDLGAPISLPRLVTWMGRGAWGRSGPAPEPWGSAPERNEYGPLGLETLGKNSLDSYLLEREAHRLGLTTVRFHSVDFHIEDPAGRAFGFHCTTGPSTSRYVTKLCGDKQITRRLLGRAGVAVPPGRLFAADDLPGAAAFARSLGWPVVVKPSDGKGGDGVTANIEDEAVLESALTGLAGAGHTQVIVEKHIPGADYRFFVVGGRVVSVVHRRPASIVGDGRSTVAELVLAKNLFRQRNPHLRTRLIRLDPHALRLLRQRDMTPDSVPGAGEPIMLTTAANLTRGGDSAEVLDETHPWLLDTAVRAVRAVPGLDHAGVDFLLEDHRRPLDRQEGAVCELNSLPGSTSHHYPVFGTARNVSAEMVEYYARQRGLRTAKQPPTISVEIRVTGTVQGVGYRHWLARLAQRLELTGWIRNCDRDDLVEAEVTGPLDLVSAVSTQAIFGPRESQPEFVETRAIEARAVERTQPVDFAVLG